MKTIINFPSIGWLFLGSQKTHRKAPPSPVIHRSSPVAGRRLHSNGETKAAQEALSGIQKLRKAVHGKFPERSLRKMVTMYCV